MSARLEDAASYMAKVPFPPMYLGADGTIWMEDGRRVATMNLRDLTLTEAFAFASAFIAAGEAITAVHPAASGAGEGE